MLRFGDTAIYSEHHIGISELLTPRRPGVRQTRRAREFKTGDVFHSSCETHAAENIGDTPTQVVMVEIKAKSPSEITAAATAQPK